MNPLPSVSSVADADNSSHLHPLKVLYDRSRPRLPCCKRRSSEAHPLDGPRDPTCVREDYTGQVLYECGHKGSLWFQSTEEFTIII